MVLSLFCVSVTIRGGLHVAKHGLAGLDLNHASRRLHGTLALICFQDSANFRIIIVIWLGLA